ncbi:DUF4184 family protein [Streptomyces graminilatus]|uniref:DUF4184 family protein n=1 Tax=Streptomyces graminilatus TaxID=1464070 RepID=UPI0006E4130B|nr:DUF4184 family protein [Streptomyces graminilatus]
MPFTLSHAAAVLPAVRADGTGRGRLIPAVLFAGSFSPDLTYFAASVLPGAMEFGSFTHSIPGVLTFDVAVAWALVALWLLLREPLVALLPRARQGRTATVLRCGTPRARVTPALALRWYASASFGALTHVVWDAFTHHDRWGVRLFPVLDRTLAGSPLYWYLQYGTSALAAVIIAGFVYHALRRTGAGEPVGVPVLSVRHRWLACAVIGGCATVGAVQRVVRWRAHWGATARPWEVIPTLCFGVGAGLLAGLVVYAVGVRAWRPGERTGATAPGDHDNRTEGSAEGSAADHAGGRTASR